MVDGHFTEDYKAFIRNQYLEAMQRRKDRNKTGRDKMKTSRDGKRSIEYAKPFSDRIILNQG